jgi:hypothetical protein
LVKGEVAYLLHSKLTALDYLVEAPHNCTVNDANAMAFKEAAKITEGRDAVEEFLVCGIWPLSDDWDLEIERMEAPLSKVTLPMPKVAATISEQFET